MSIMVPIGNVITTLIENMSDESRAAAAASLRRLASSEQSRNSERIFYREQADALDEYSHRLMQESLQG